MSKITFKRQCTLGPHKGRSAKGHGPLTKIHIVIAPFGHESGGCRKSCYSTVQKHSPKRPFESLIDWSGTKARIHKGALDQNTRCDYAWRVRYVGLKKILLQYDTETFPRATFWMIDWLINDRNILIFVCKHHFDHPFFLHLLVLAIMTERTQEFQWIQFPKVSVWFFLQENCREFWLPTFVCFWLFETVTPHVKHLLIFLLPHVLPIAHIGMVLHFKTLPKTWILIDTYTECTSEWC